MKKEFFEFDKNAKVRILPVMSTWETMESKRIKKIKKIFS